MKGYTNGEGNKGGYVPCSFSTGTDAEVVEALQQHYAGNCDIHDYWSVGDTRTIEMYPYGSFDWVLMDSTCTGFSLEYNEQVTPAFICGMKNIITEGQMNETNTNAGGWVDCYMSESNLPTIYSVISSKIKPIFKQFYWYLGYPAGGSTSGTTVYSNYLGLPPEKCVFGSATYSQTDEGALYNQWEWYQTASNRIKNYNGSADYWWECSPSSGHSNGFCYVLTTAQAWLGNASLSFGISPFGCI